MRAAVARAPAVIWLNGACGVGKTTVAELLVERIDGATLVDPELVGSLLRALVPEGWQTEDFQDMPLRRSLTREAIAGLVDDADCVASLADPRFAEHVDADARDAWAVAADIVGRLPA